MKKLIFSAKIWALLGIVALSAVLVYTFALAATPRVTDLVIGDAAGPPGQRVSLPLNMNTQGQPIRAFLLNFSYDGDVLTNGTIELSPFIFPSTWEVSSNLAGPGDLRVLGVDLEATGLKISGHVFNATFDISSTADPDIYPITTSLVTMSDVPDGNPLTVSVLDGSVTVVDLILNHFIIIGLPSEILSAEITDEAGNRAFKGEPGTTDQLVVTARFTDGTQKIITDQIVWTVIDQSVATITSTGEITIGATGSTVAVGVFTSR